MLESKPPTGASKKKNIKLSCFVLDVPVGNLVSSMAILYHMIVNCKGPLEAASLQCRIDSGVVEYLYVTKRWGSGVATKKLNVLLFTILSNAHS